MKARCNAWHASDMQCYDMQCYDMQCYDMQCSDVQCYDMQCYDMQWLAIALHVVTLQVIALNCIAWHYIAHRLHCMLCYLDWFSFLKTIISLKHIALKMCWWINKIKMFTIGKNTWLKIFNIDHCPKNILRHTMSLMLIRILLFFENFDLFEIF